MYTLMNNCEQSKSGKMLSGEWIGLTVRLVILFKIVDSRTILPWRDHWLLKVKIDWCPCRRDDFGPGSLWGGVASVDLYKGHLSLPSLIKFKMPAPFLLMRRRVGFISHRSVDKGVERLASGTVKTSLSREVKAAVPVNFYWNSVKSSYGRGDIGDKQRSLNIQWLMPSGQIKHDIECLPVYRAGEGA